LQDRISIQRELSERQHSFLLDFVLLCKMNVTIPSSLPNVTGQANSHLSAGVDFFFTHIYLLLLVIIGSVGNAFVIIIFVQKAFRTTVRCSGSSLSIYPFLFYMAISDTMYLSILFCLWLTNYVNVLHRPVICQFTLYVTYVCNFVNAYYTVAFTAQRLFAVVKPFRVSHFLSWYRSRCLALSIIVLACLLYSYLPFLLDVIDGKCYSRKKYRRINEYMDIADCIIVFLIPYIAIISMNTIILVRLHRMKNNRLGLLFRNHSQLNQMREITRRIASRKMTKLLLAVSTSYLIICAPYACIHTWRLLVNWHGTKARNLMMEAVEGYSLLIYHISFAMNFYLYIAFGSKFRREWKRILLRARQKVQLCFKEREQFFEQDQQLELTGKHSSATTADYPFSGNTHTNTNERSSLMRSYFCCHFRE
jgi:hypothetical protein